MLLKITLAYQSNMLTALKEATKTKEQSGQHSQKKILKRKNSLTVFKVSLPKLLESTVFCCRVMGQDK